MKKRKIILIIVTGTLFIILGVTLKVYEIDYSQKGIYLNEFKTKKIYNCKSTNCITNYYDTYETIDYNGNNKNIKKLLKEINKKTYKYYNLVKNDKVNKKQCDSYTDILLKDTSIVTEYYLYENERYISIVLDRQKSYICLNKIEQLPIEVYIYNKKKNIVETQKEFRQEQGLTDKDINKSIINGINKYNLTSDKKIKSKDTRKKGKRKNIVFYDNNGNLAVLFYNYKEKDYYFATINKKKK